MKNDQHTQMLHQRASEQARLGFEKLNFSSRHGLNVSGGFVP
jgi:hypothetical protein